MSSSTKTTYDNENAPAMAAEEREEIKNILTEFFHQMEIPLPDRAAPFDQEFADGVYLEALRLGFRKEDIDAKAFQKALYPSVVMSIVTYGHLKDIKTRYYIALYTAILIFFDDLCETSPEACREFHTRFICGEPQKHRLLDNLAALLQLSRERFNSHAANLFLSSSLDFLTGTVLDYDTKKMKIQHSAASYPRYFRTLMGDATAYTVFAFPPHISVGVYIQVLPTMIDVINDINDVLSFYKEQVAREDTNHISLIAEMNHWSKLAALQHVADSIVVGTRRIKSVLVAHPEAYDVFFKAFLPGYFGFHTGSEARYKLHELLLMDSSLS